MIDNDILTQVRVSLDEFDTQHLEVSTRRAYRIARARGDSTVAHRLMLELNFSAPAVDRSRTVMTIHEGTDHDTLKQKHRAVTEEWIASRRLGQAGQESADPKLLVGSVAEMRAQLENLERQHERAVTTEDWNSVNLLFPAILERRELMEPDPPLDLRVSSRHGEAISVE